jgi:hypothetical protein
MCFSVSASVSLDPFSSTATVCTVFNAAALPNVPPDGVHPLLLLLLLLLLQ